MTFEPIPSWPAQPVVFFERRELETLLRLYGRMVAAGEWRDYAIAGLKDSAVFSVFRSTHETPLYSIAKYPSRSMVRPPRYVVYAGEQTIAQSSSLSEALAVFSEEP